MKRIASLCLSFCLLCSCGDMSSNDKKKPIDSLKNTVYQSTKMPRDTTKIKVNFDKEEPNFYSKSDLANILEFYPELNQESYDSPDISWNNRGLCGDSTDHWFSGEAGQDQYYVLYGYYHRQRNGEQNLQNERKKITILYQKINEIFGKLSHGGTGFGHLYQRIEGYVEHDLDLLIYERKSSREKKYDITKQKKIFIQSLRQIVADETHSDIDITDDLEKTSQINELNKVIDKIDEEITEYFYLKKTQLFCYEHYR